MKTISTGLAAGALALALIPGAAVAQEPATVTVRVEGLARTLVPETHVTTTRRPVRKQEDPAQACPGTTVGGALEEATDGDWGGSYDPNFGQTVETIRGQSYPLAGPEPRFWSLWVNGQPSDSGACAKELEDGDEVLFFVDCYGAGCVNPVPLRLVAPARVKPGERFTVRVQELAASGARSPAAGVAVRAAGEQATTGEDGRASLTAPDRDRELTVRATRENAVRDAELVRVGETGPETTIRRIRDGRTYSERRAPRRLRGRAEAEDLRAVKLRLTRRAGGRCEAFSPGRRAFRRIDCGEGWFFRVGSDAAWFYRLPDRLDSGRYRLEVKAIDREGNAGPLTEVGFRVR